MDLNVKPFSLEVDLKPYPAPEDNLVWMNLGSADSHLPFEGIDEVRVDIDGEMQPDVVMDARNLSSFGTRPYEKGKRNVNCFKKGTFDGVWCSHMLEHFNEDDGHKVLEGISHVLKEGGILVCMVPDLQAAFEKMKAEGRSLCDVLYMSPMGAIRGVDMMYGFPNKKEAWRHKFGFDSITLGRVLRKHFNKVFIKSENLELRAIACKTEIPDWAANLFGIQKSPSVPMPATFKPLRTIIDPSELPLVRNS